jgi:DNA (cytosine-5)-methyltransferase 1
MNPRIIKEGNYSPSNHNASSIVNGEGIAPTVMENHGTVTAVKIPAETICLNSKVNGKQPSVQDRIYDTEGIATACTTSFHPSIAIPQATKQGYIEVGVGGVFDAAYPESTTRRGRVQEGGKVTPTICTSNELCVYEGVKEEDWKTVVGNKQMNPFRGSLENESPCITSACGAGGGMTPMVTNAELETTKTKEFIEQMRGHKPLEYRIRKLSPRECFRLMGVTEENIDKIQAAGISNAQQYKMAGNSIVVDVLYYIFRKMFVDKESDHAELTLF